MDGRRQIDLLLNEIEAKGESCDLRCLQLINDCLDLISEKLPNVAATGHRALKAYLNGTTPEASLEEARVECWTYLDTLGARKRDLSDPKVCAVSAVICGLYPKASLCREDLVDYLGFFFELANVVEPRYQEAQQLLRRYSQ